MKGETYAMGSACTWDERRQAVLGIAGVKRIAGEEADEICKGDRSHLTKDLIFHMKVGTLCHRICGVA